MKVEEQFRVIHIPDKNYNKDPEYPVLVFLNSGLVYEANSVRAAAAVVVQSTINEPYEDVEFWETEWILRLQAARRYAMILAEDLNLVVWSEKEGKIKDNYAADEADPDYAEDPGYSSRPEYKILIDDEISFLKTLCVAGVIRIFVKEGFDSFGQSEKKRGCANCALRREERCSVYGNTLYNKDAGEQLKDAEGENCMSYTSSKGGSGTEYRDIISGEKI